MSEPAEQEGVEVNAGAQNKESVYKKYFVFDIKTVESQDQLEDGSIKRPMHTKKTAKCRFCDKVLQRTSHQGTSTMKRHLKCHPDKHTLLTVELAKKAEKQRMQKAEMEGKNREDSFPALSNKGESQAILKSVRPARLILRRFTSWL